MDVFQDMKMKLRALESYFHCPSVCSLCSIIPVPPRLTAVAASSVYCTLLNIRQTIYPVLTFATLMSFIIVSSYKYIIL